MRKKAETKTSLQALQASETRYRRLFETAQDGILILNAETGEIDDVNPYMIDMLHYSREEFVGMKLWEVSPFKDKVFNQAAFEELQDKGYIRYKDLPLETKEGKPIAVEFVSNVYKANGDIVIQCNIRNITERKQSEQALLESEERFRRITESLQEAVWSSDLSGKFDFLSPIMTSIYGRPLSEMMGYPDFWIDASHPEDQALVRASKEALFRDDRVELDYRIILPDGTVRWIYDRKLLLRNEYGEPSRIVGIVSDITDRKKAEESLLLKNLVFDASIAANSIADLSGNITEANNAFFQMWGYPGKDEVFGKPITHFFNNPGEAAGIFTALNENGKWEGDYTAKKNDGSTFIAHGLATVVRDNKGKVIGYQSAVIDITARRQAEDALQESEQKYKELFERMSSAVAVYDAVDDGEDFVFQDFNSAGEAIEKINREDIIGKRITEVFHGAKEFGIIEVFQRVWKTGEFEYFPARLYKDQRNVGTWRENWVYKLPSGKIVSVYNNITERKQAEEELRRMNAFLDSIVENIPNMIFLKDARELRFIRFNRAGENLLGISRDNLVGKNDYDFFSKEQADSFTQKDREVLRGKESVDIPEESLQTRNKGERILHTQKVPILDARGEPEYLLGISEDITSRMHAEEELKQTMEKLRKSLIGTIQALSSMVETRDPYTSGHQRRVSSLARAIAQEMGLSSDMVDTIRMAGIIHDIGKISVPAEILVKPGKISDIEMSLIKVHSQSGYDILKDVGLPYPVAEIVLQHHERLDGSGYPQGLKGDQILLEAQIISVADVVEAISSHRPYRPALGMDTAIEEIEKNKSVLYDEKVVEVCIKLFREKGFSFE